jgi:hypothetical protein
MISVSTTFFPGAELDVLPTDLIIISSDSVFFYVHTNKLLAASTNEFNSHLPLKELDRPEGAGNILPLHIDSVVLNILLHTIYNMPAVHYAPLPEAVITAVESLEKFGLSVQTYLAPATPFSMLFLGTAPRAPIEFYACAGAYDLNHLAIPISSFLLSFPLASLTDVLAVKMGPLYLKRLFFLHLGRVEALKRLLLPPPQPHVPTTNCDVTEQKKLTRAWALASAYLAWDVRPGESLNSPHRRKLLLIQHTIDLSTPAIEIALRPLGDYLGCDQCNQLLRERINNLVALWSIVKVCCFFPIEFSLITFCYTNDRERCSLVRTRRRISSKSITHKKSPLITLVSVRSLSALYIHVHTFMRICIIFFSY